MWRYFEICHEKFEDISKCDVAKRLMVFWNLLQNVWRYFELCHKMLGYLSWKVWRYFEMFYSKTFEDIFRHVSQNIGDILKYGTKCLEIRPEKFKDILKCVLKCLEIFWNISQNVWRYFEIYHKMFGDMLKCGRLLGMSSQRQRSWPRLSIRGR